MKNILLSLILLLSTASLSNAVFAEPKPGQDFDAVAQVIPTENPAKIEVMEIFWYGCDHCYQMETPLKVWLKKIPADVNFKRMPGLPGAAWAPMAKAYFTMESLGIEDKLHHSLFEAVHKHKTLNPKDEKATLAWLTNKSGLDRAKVESTFNSFTVNTNLKRAAQVFRASGATGVPSLIVDGKYITSGTMAGGNAKALEVVNYIVKNVRATRAKAAKPVKK
ncbi:MAG: thiol:disulfide interchange protein DsbA/DsbL [Methylophilaceae bacterium]